MLKIFEKGQMNTRQQELAAHLQIINAAIDYCIAVSGFYDAALELLRKNGIETRFDTFIAGDNLPEVLVGLRELRVGLEMEIEDISPSN